MRTTTRLPFFGSRKNISTPEALRLYAQYISARGESLRWKSRLQLFPPVFAMRMHRTIAKDLRSIADALESER